MDLNKQPQRKKPLPVRLQDPKENITSVSKRPAKSKKMEIDSSKETEVDLSKETEVPSYHLNKRPQRLQDPKENITFGSKRPAKSKKMGIDNNPEEEKIKIHDVKETEFICPRKFD